MKPLKRHPTPIELSHNHHRSLSLCVRLLHTPTESHQAELKPHFPELLEHFLEEETSFAPYQPRIDNALCRRFETDHAKLRTAVAAPERTSEVQNKDFATALRDHARFEERELFPVVEACLDTPE